MKRRGMLLLIGFTLALTGAVVAAQAQKPQIAIPNPGVPQIQTLEGRYVRIAYNNEGYVSLGYRAANDSVSEEWLLLETGITVRDGVKSFDLPRANVSLTTPDEKTLPLPTNEEYLKADLRALEMRASAIRDSINYFPPGASRPCRIGYFASIESRAMPWDVVELSSDRACLGRLYFKVPGGIKYGQHWLNVKFRDSLVRVPFRILTKEEDKLLDKNFKDIKKQVDEAFKKK